MTQLPQFSIMFGLDPSSRTGLEVPDTIGIEEETFLLGGLKVDSD